MFKCDTVTAFILKIPGLTPNYLFVWIELSSEADLSGTGGNPVRKHYNLSFRKCLWREFYKP